MSDHCVILFPTSAHVMRAEKLLQEAAISCRLIPVPRHLSSDCGFCLEVKYCDCANVCALFDDKKLIYDETARLT